MYENSAQRITTLYCFEFFSRMERACLFARGCSIYSWMKTCFLSTVSYWNEIFKVLTPRICWLYGNCLVNTTLGICWHYLLTRQGKSFKGKFFSLCCSNQAKISQVFRSFFLHVWNFLPSCVYLSLSSVDLF